jgi:hypothetical protein
LYLDPPNIMRSYPKALASIGGTGSQPGIFRLERDVLSRKPDLVFLDFTVNDNSYTAGMCRRWRHYECILREISTSGAAIVPVLMCGHPRDDKGA